MQFSRLVKTTFLASLSTTNGFAVGRRSLVSSHAASIVHKNWLKRKEWCPLAVRGGSSLTSNSLSTSASLAMSTTTEAETAPVEIQRSSYKPLPYKVDNVEMNFDIREGETVVETTLRVVGGRAGDGELQYS
jgi:hypothetical protein